MSSGLLRDNFANRFGGLRWGDDRMLIDEFVFRLGHYCNDSWELGDNCFVFYKIKELVDQYACFWSLRESFRVDRLFELGIWDGGSIAFWNETLRPVRHVAIDIADKADSDYFKRYVEKKYLSDRIDVHWNTNQADKDTLNRIVCETFDGPLDVVIDDASHMYGPTQASFEALFPHLRPGGLYIIEDWAWAHWKGFENFAPNQPSLEQLIFKLVEATGTSKTLISNLTVYEGFAVVEKGPERQSDTENFWIDQHIYRGRSEPPLTAWKQTIASAKAITKRLLK